MVDRSSPDTTVLLNCPFCDGKSIDPTFWSSADYSGPGCDDCGATAETPEKWNMRAVAATPTERAAELIHRFEYESMALHKIQREWLVREIGAALSGSDAQCGREPKRDVDAERSPEAKEWRRRRRIGMPQ